VPRLAVSRKLYDPEVDGKTAQCATMLDIPENERRPVIEVFYQLLTYRIYR